MTHAHWRRFGAKDRSVAVRYTTPQLSHISDSILRDARVMDTTRRHVRASWEKKTESLDNLSRPNQHPLSIRRRLLRRSRPLASLPAGLASLPVGQ